MAEIELKSISKSFGSTEVIKSLDLSISNGEFITIVGPSGCGKSTLLRVIAGLENQSSGDVEIDGNVVNNTRASDRDLAMVFQSYALYPHLTVQQNLMVPLKLRRLSFLERFPIIGWFMPNRRTKLDEIVSKAQVASDTLQITHLLDRKPGQLSGGQQQRVAVGRAMVREPVAYLMDEPLSNLDAGLRVHMRAEISELHTNLKTTFIYVTHDKAEALTMSDRMDVMMDGEIHQLDTPHEIYNNPSTIRVAEFVGSPKINILNGEYDEKGNLNCFGTKITDSIKLAKKGNISVGIRPEHMELVSSNDKNAFKGEIVYRENLGSDIFLHLTINEGEQKLIVRSEPSKGINNAVGDQVMIGWDEQKVLVFDVDGKNITMQ